MIKSKNNKNNPLILGILGGGQLAKMLSLEAYKMGINISIIEKSSKTPAGEITQNEFPQGWKDRAELDKFIEISEVITLENEFIDPEILSYIEQKRKVFPSSKTISLIQDKFTQKETFASTGIPLPNYSEINSPKEAKYFAEKNSFPIVIKTRKYGYDGYGNFTAKNNDDIEKGFLKFHKDEKRPLLAESFVDFECELAVMVARSSEGEEIIYECVETIQQNHICHKVIAPARVSLEIRQKAQRIALDCVRAIGGVGVFGVELFLTKSGELLVNEIAPRPHNSGHYTIESCRTSQYENAIRAVLGLPLGSADMIKPCAVMINLLGEKQGDGVPENVVNLLTHKNIKLHLYNKKSSRIGRKMGHITLIGDDLNDVIKEIDSAYKSLVW
jgi:5-(carboxyamino)imidazole ribonucleotide synthase